VIDDMESGILIHSKNPSEIARAIMFLIEEPERRKRLAQAIDERIAKKFSLEQMIDGTLRVYDASKQPAD
jgi:glycosyltransferase involved in cell wall biosynthesis